MPLEPASPYPLLQEARAGPRSLHQPSAEKMRKKTGSVNQEREGAGERGVKTGQAPAEFLTEMLADTAPNARRPGREGLEGCLGLGHAGSPCGRQGAHVGEVRQ